MTSKRQPKKSEDRAFQSRAKEKAQALTSVGKEEGSVDRQQTRSTPQAREGPVSHQGELTWYSSRTKCNTPLNLSSWGEKNKTTEK